MKTKRSILINSLDEDILFSTDIPYIFDLMLSLYPARFIPEYNVSENIGGRDYRNIIEYLKGKPSEIVDISQNYKKMKVHVEKYSYGETSFLILQLLERLLEERDMYITHTSAVSKDGKGILVSSSTGGGKTRLSLELYKRGFDYIGNEHTVINPIENMIYGGTKVMTVKKPYIHEIERKMIEFPTDDGDEIYLVDLKNEARVSHKATISLIVEPIVYPANTNIVKVEKSSEFRIRDQLMELSSGLIRGSFVYLNKFDFLSQSLDTEELSRKRCHAFFEILKKDIPKYTVIGDLKNVTTIVEKLFEEET